MEKSSEIFIVAGEESANQYASRLIDEFSGENIKFSGIGFSNLKEKEFDLVYDAENLAVMGVFEVLAKYRKIKDAFSLSIDYIKKHKPSVVVLIDFGGFNLKLAQKIKEEGLDIKILYFISPKIWAWGQKRALKVKKYIDQMYVIHPFEVDFYKKWGVDAKFVGHPILDELDKKFLDQEWIEAERSKEGIEKNKVLGVLLGSREREIQKHLIPFTKVAQKLKLKNPDLDVVFILPPSKTKKEYEKLLSKTNLKDSILLQSKNPMDKISLCDVCLVASGTATLQVGVLGIPMAIGYIMNPLTMKIFMTFVKGVKYAGLVNIIKEKEVSKEFLQNNFIEEDVTSYLNTLLNDLDANYKQSKELESLRDELGRGDVFKRLKSEISLYL